MSLPREEVYMRKMSGALLPASNERKSERGYAVLGTAYALAPSKLGDASCLGWAQKTTYVGQKA